MIPPKKHIWTKTDIAVLRPTTQNSEKERNRQLHIVVKIPSSHDSSDVCQRPTSLKNRRVRQLLGRSLPMFSCSLATDGHSMYTVWRMRLHDGSHSGHNRKVHCADLLAEAQASLLVSSIAAIRSCTHDCWLKEFL